MLRFHVAAEAVPKENPDRAMLERALDSADRLMAEGRDRVNRLRAQPAESQDLSNALKAVGRELSSHQSVRFQMKTLGTVSHLRPEVYEELFSIGREAIRNAFTHSQATLVSFAIDFSPLLLTIVCHDNGLGIGVQTAADMAKPGRWGLVGMLERAERIGAVLKIEPGTAGGTTVNVSIEARLVYDLDRKAQC